MDRLKFPARCGCALVAIPARYYLAAWLLALYWFPAALACSPAALACSPAALAADAGRHVAPAVCGARYFVDFRLVRADGSGARFASEVTVWRMPPLLASS